MTTAIAAVVLTLAALGQHDTDNADEYFDGTLLSITIDDTADSIITVGDNENNRYVVVVTKDTYIHTQGRLTQIPLIRLKKWFKTRTNMVMRVYYKADGNNLTASELAIARLSVTDKKPKP